MSQEIKKCLKRPKIFTIKQILNPPNICTLTAAEGKPTTETAILFCVPEEGLTIICCTLRKANVSCLKVTTKPFLRKGKSKFINPTKDSIIGSIRRLLRAIGFTLSE